MCARIDGVVRRKPATSVHIARGMLVSKKKHRPIATGSRARTRTIVSSSRGSAGLPERTQTCMYPGSEAPSAGSETSADERATRRLHIRRVYGRRGPRACARVTQSEVDTRFAELETRQDPQAPRRESCSDGGSRHGRRRPGRARRHVPVCAGASRNVPSRRARLPP